MRTLLPWLRAASLVALLAFGGPVNCLAQADADGTEYRVKAAFLYKFGEYVEWPGSAFAGPDTELAIGVLGADRVADELARVVAGRTVGDRHVSVRKLRLGDPMTGLHVLFVGHLESGRLPELLAASRGHTVLTITESDQAFAHGSMINFVVVDDKVRFDIALQPAEQSNLKISARLLSVARKVVARPL